MYHVSALVVQCASIDVPHSTKTPTDDPLDYNVTITYTCDPGFQNSTGDLVRICNASSQWTGITPTCEGINIIKVYI